VEYNYTSAKKNNGIETGRGEEISKPELRNMFSVVYSARQRCNWQVSAFKYDRLARPEVG
jgi:hypothetical protein